MSTAQPLCCCCRIPCRARLQTRVVSLPRNPRSRFKQCAAARCIRGVCRRVRRDLSAPMTRLSRAGATAHSRSLLSCVLAARAEQEQREQPTLHSLALCSRWSALYVQTRLPRSRTPPVRALERRRRSVFKSGSLRHAAQEAIESDRRARCDPRTRRSSSCCRR